jgi:uncharacterized peroxidase-related enzyme
MSRITTVNQTEAVGKAKELLDGVQKKLGFAPNMMKTMAQSPTVLEAYLNFNGTLARGVLSHPLREQIALVSAETNACAYCASAHSIVGKSAGLTNDEITAARSGLSNDVKTDAALKFARSIIVNRGAVGDEEVAAIKAAGYGEAEIAEIIAHVALNAFTNYFNKIAETEIDFPKVEFPLSRAVNA